MNRTVKNRTVPNVKPVDKIKLSEKRTRWRLAAAIVALVIGLIAFSYGMVSCFSEETGWTTIEVASSADTNCSSDFVFQYQIGASGASAAVENREISELYTEAVVKAYQIFNNDQEIGDVCNVYSINQHPNEELEVDEVLYAAFEQLEEAGNRNIYLGPVYVEYDNMFFCQDDSEIMNYDPFQNEEVKSYVEKVAEYASDANHISLELLGDNKIKLHVSEEYQAYAAENFITSYIDFYWMKNAFIIDYLADTMIEHGYILGSISSYDGFVRNMDENSGQTYGFQIYDRKEQVVYPAGVMEYTGARSIVSLRNYVMNELDEYRFYQLDNGEIRTPYVDLADGLSKTSINDLTACSTDMGCAEILLQMIPVYIAENFDTEKVNAWTADGINSIYCEANLIYYNGEDVKFTDLYDKAGNSYGIELIEE